MGHPLHSRNKKWLIWCETLCSRKDPLFPWLKVLSFNEALTLFEKTANRDKMALQGTSNFPHLK